MSREGSVVCGTARASPRVERAPTPTPRSRARTRRRPRGGSWRGSVRCSAGSDVPSPKTGQLIAVQGQALQDLVSCRGAVTPSSQNTCWRRLFIKGRATWRCSPWQCSEPGGKHLAAVHRCNVDAYTTQKLREHETIQKAQCRYSSLTDLPVRVYRPPGSATVAASSMPWPPLQ